MASCPPLFYLFSSRIPCHRNANATMLSSTPSPCSSFSNLPCHRSGQNWNFMTFLGIRHIWKSLSVKATSTTRGNLSSRMNMTNVDEKPDHLLVLVHGIMGSPSDWTCCEAELKNQLGKNYLIFVSSCNMYIKTFTGIDGAGKRLADEVMEIVKKTQSLRKISFLGHSLGGLIARYAVAVLFTPNTLSDNTLGTDAATTTKSKTFPSGAGLIAGLDAITFITLATPHLGVRGNKQLPFLLGMQFLEKLAAPIAPIVTGQTGGQLFLTDGKPDKAPLLLRMASDCEEGNFLSALSAFKCRVLYANVSYDHMVGWRTSSIRRETELAERPSQPLDGYEHIVRVQNCPPVISENPNFPPEATGAKEDVQNEPNTQNTVEYHEIMEEEMVRGLQQLGWIKVDVCFNSSSYWPFFAHDNIQMKSAWFHNVGLEVVADVANAIKQHDSSTCIRS